MVSIAYLCASFVFQVKIYVLWICSKVKEKDAVLTMGDSATSLSLLFLPFSYFQLSFFTSEVLLSVLKYQALLLQAFPFVQDKIL